MARHKVCSGGPEMTAPQEKRAAPRDSPVAVLAKAGALLDCLADGELTPAELTVRMGEPRSSVYRLIASLSELELIDPGTQRGTYRLGLKLLRLGGIVMAGFDWGRPGRADLGRDPQGAGGGGVFFGGRGVRGGG